MLEQLAFPLFRNVQRDKTNLDIFWLKDDSLEDASNLPPTDVIAAEIIENLEAALEQFRGVAEVQNQLGLLYRIK